MVFVRRNSAHLAHKGTVQVEKVIYKLDVRFVLWITLRVKWVHLLIFEYLAIALQLKRLRERQDTFVVPIILAMYTV